MLGYWNERSGEGTVLTPITDPSHFPHNVLLQCLNFFLKKVDTTFVIKSQQINQTDKEPTAAILQGD